MENNSKLYRGLNFIDSFSIVVGTVIGTGVFLKTATMAQLLNSQYLVLLAWTIAGLLSLMGSLTYAEIGSMFLKAGGEYVYIRNAYGNLLAFLYGWMRFWIASPGSIAAYAVGTATFLSAIISLSIFEKNVVSITIVIIFSLLNCLKISVGGVIQSFLTFLKIAIILFIIYGILFYSKNNFSSLNFSVGAISQSDSFYKNFSAALIAALWAYDGWNNLPMVAGEVNNPEKNVPRSLIYGMSVVLFLYLLVNYCYFQALPIDQIITSNSKSFPNGLPVATNAITTFLKSNAIIFLSSAFILSSIGALNGAIMTSARVPYAMAQDGLFFKAFSKVGKKTFVPYFSVLVQGIISVILSLTGTFDQLTDYVVFSSWIFYTLVIFSVFIFRKRKMISKYKTIFYPLPPILFIFLALFILGNTINNDPTQSLIGIMFILLGIPAYYLFK